MLQEIGHLQEIVNSLSQQTADPTILPPSSEQVVLDLSKGQSSSRSFTVSRSLLALQRFFFQFSMSAFDVKRKSFFAVLLREI